jgi:hypothetical protein
VSVRGFGGGRSKGQARERCWCVGSSAASGGGGSAAGGEGGRKKGELSPFFDRGGSRERLTARRLCSAEARTTTADLLT